MKSSSTSPPASSWRVQVRAALAEQAADAVFGAQVPHRLGQVDHALVAHDLE